VQATSTYRKIRQVLDAASQGGGNIGQLAERIAGSYDAFVYYRRDKDTNQVQQEPVGHASIRRQIRFCIALGLLKDEDDCSLTTSGTRASEDERFDLTLRGAVLAYLERNDLPWEEIQNGIAEHPFPDANVLYGALNPKITEDRFRTCLFLLSQCGAERDQNVLKPYQKKLYLTEARVSEV
jgi:hypothetical protein